MSSSILISNGLFQDIAPGDIVNVIIVVLVIVDVFPFLPVSAVVVLSFCWRECGDCGATRSGDWIVDLSGSRESSSE